MPGICGFLDSNGPTDPAGTLSNMLEAMRHHDWYVDQHYCKPSLGAGIGRMSLGFVNKSAGPARIGGDVAVMDGELYDTSDEDHTQSLLEGFQHGGNSYLSQVHGSFAAAILHEGSRGLTLVNDRFGMRPIYYKAGDGRFVFASSIAALLSHGTISRSPSIPGVVDFFTYGQYMGNRTSLEDVQVLPAGAVATYDAASDTFQINPYRRLPTHTDSSSSELEQLKRIDQAFYAAVDRRIEGTNRLGLAISGGLDARAILGVMDTDKVMPTALCYSVPGSLDHRSSQRMAEVVGCGYHHYALDASFLREFPAHLNQMVRLTDGQFLSQCIALPTLPLFRELGIDVLLRGHGGELMHMQKAYAYSVDDLALTIRDDATLEHWLFEHLQGFMLAEVDGPLFASQFHGDVPQIARESLRACLAQLGGIDPPLQRIWHMFVEQRLRRETVLSLAKFGSAVEIRVPYIDNDLVDLLLATPPSLKLTDVIQEYILRKRRPAFLDIVNANTGTRVGASQLASRVSTLRMRVLAKLGVPGYQPYERLGLWLRQELAPLVKSVLLQEECLEAGIFNPDTIKTVVRQHLENRRNHTFLLMALMIYQLGQQHLQSDDPLDLALGAGSTGASSV